MQVLPVEVSDAPTHTPTSVPVQSYAVVATALRAPEFHTPLLVHVLSKVLAKALHPARVVSYESSAVAEASAP